MLTQTVSKNNVNFSFLIREAMHQHFGLANNPVTIQSLM